jgi:hypothetical protein
MVFCYTHNSASFSVLRKSLPHKYMPCIFRQPHTYIQTNKHTHMCVCIVTKHFLRCPKLLNTHQHIFFHIRRVRQLKSSKEQQQQQDHICAICGRPAKTSIFKQKVGDTYYIVDKDECATLLKRFHSVYGNDFCLMFKEQ